MNVTLDRSEDHNATLTVELAREDYMGKFDALLKDFRKKGTFKGFRQGKAPMGYIRKIYGQAALADAVNDVLQKAVGDYLREHEVKYIGQPLPSEQQGDQDFDASNPDAYKFVFDMGLVPEFDVQGTDGEIERFDVEVSDESVEREWTGNLKRMGSQVEAEDTIAEGDVLFVRAVEQTPVSADREPLVASFAVAVDDLGDEQVRKNVLTLKKGDKFTFDPATLEKGRDLDFVKRYHLGLEDEPEREIAGTFEAEIEKVQRRAPANVDQELFDNLFGPDKITSEEDAKAEIRRLIKESLDRQADAVLYRQMQKRLMAANALVLPKTFLQRWLDYNRKESEPEPSEHDREHFLLDLKWQLIKEKLIEMHNIEVNQQELEAGAYRRVAQYVGPYGDESVVQRLINAVLSNEDQVNRIIQEITAAKVFEALKGSLQVKDKPIAEQAFREESERILEEHDH